MSLSLKKKFPNYIQIDSMDCGPTCLRIISKFYGKSVPKHVSSELANLGLGGVSIKNLEIAAQKLNFSTLPVNIDYSILKEQAPLPCIVYWQQRHFVVVYKVKNGKVYVSDPAIGLITYKEEDFLKGWLDDPLNPDSNGIAILLEPKAGIQLYSIIVRLDCYYNHSTYSSISYSGRSRPRYQF